MKIILLTILLMVSSCTKHESESTTTSSKFNLPTADGETMLTGFLDVPEVKADRYPVVIMVPGTGLFDAEVNFGKSKSGQDLIFKEIAKNLNKAGFATVRYNYRGVNCNFKNQPICQNCSSEEEKMSNFLKSCFDFKIREKVTVKNIQSDLEQIFKWAAKQPNIDSARVVAFGHSEGSIHISELIANGVINPAAVVFMGGVSESPESILKWQTVDRLVDGVMSFDKNKDKKVSNEELQKALPTSYLNVFPFEQLRSPKDFWTKATLSALANTQYNQLKKTALATADEKPYGSGGAVQASFQWWKMWFTDKTKVVDNLKNFKGKVRYHNGDFDSQTNATREILFFNKAKKPNWKFTVHEKKGHTLGADPLFGPVDESSMKILIEDIKQL